MQAVGGLIGGRGQRSDGQELQNKGIQWVMRASAQIEVKVDAKGMASGQLVVRSTMVNEPWQREAGAQPSLREGG